MTIEELCEQAEQNPGVEIPLGSIVVCDVCGVDYTTKEDSGGFIFGSRAYCPACAPKGLASIQKYEEEHLIRCTCPEGQSFADFVRDYRGEDASISITRI